MKFTAQKIPGLYLVEVEPKEDERGYFARSYDEAEFRAHGLHTRFPQCSISHNKRKHSVRGMHFQSKPHEEAKMIRVTRGALYDVALDLRRDSPTYLQWQAFELKEGDGRQLYIPEGCAHGFQTLADNTEVYYMIAIEYNAGASSGARHDDPAFKISWPHPIATIAPRDLSFPVWVP